MYVKKLRPQDGNSQTVGRQRGRPRDGSWCGSRGRHRAKGFRTKLSELRRERERGKTCGGSHEARNKPRLWNVASASRRRPYKDVSQQPSPTAAGQISRPSPSVDGHNLSTWCQYIRFIKENPRILCCLAPAATTTTSASK